MNDLDRIANELNAADIPKEVWIGTDSTADRVSWLIIRNKLNQQNSRSRLHTMNELGRLVEIAMTTSVLPQEWRNDAQKALEAAGLRRPIGVS